MDAKRMKITFEHVEYLLKNYTKKELAEQIVMYAQTLEEEE